MTSIYAILHPVTNELRYVGKTILPVEKRVYQHSILPKTLVYSWINELSVLNLVPKIKVLQRTRKNKAVEAEDKWIKFYSNRGCRLLNKDFNFYNQPSHNINNHYFTFLLNCNSVLKLIKESKKNKVAPNVLLQRLLNKL